MAAHQFTACQKTQQFNEEFDRKSKIDDRRRAQLVPPDFTCDCGSSRKLCIPMGASSDIFRIEL